MRVGFKVDLDLDISRPALPGRRPARSHPRAAPVVRRGVWHAVAILAFLSVALLVASDLILAAFPVQVRVAGDERAVAVAIDGVTRVVDLTRPVQAVRFVPAPPGVREYQIDGSDTTNNFTYQSDYFASFAQMPYYRFQAWLRDEGSYSVWRDFAVRDVADHLVARQARPVEAERLPIPTVFSLDVALHRMEVPRTVEFLDGADGATRLELNRNDKYARVVRVVPGAPDEQLARWYLPLSWQAALAEVLYLVLRACALALLLLVIVVALTALVPARAQTVPVALAHRLLLGLALCAALAASLYCSFALFDRQPTIYDGMSYYFQAKTFAAGMLAAPTPPVPEAFPLPFALNRDGQWFSMYTPGTALLLLPGFRLGVPWLAEPLLAVAGIALTYAVARRQFGPNTALLAAVLMASSPFLHLQAGTYMSHVPGMFCATVLLYAIARYTERAAHRWAALAGVALGLLFLTREMSAILYTLVLAPLLLRRAYGFWRSRERSPRRLLGDAALALAILALCGGAYLAYNRALTGSAQLLPRVVFSATENRYGFGEAVGFYGRHTLGGGLVNADEALTALTLILFGWPFYFSLSALLLPFLLRRARTWEWVYGALALAFVLAYIGLYYHGIAYGPRYYFDALPALVILTARGIAALAAAAAAIWQGSGRARGWPQARTAALVLCGLLALCNVLYFWPQQTRLYESRSGRVGVGTPALGPFIRQGLAGRESTLSRAMVVTRDAGLLQTFQALNCPRLDCDTVFAFAPDDATEQRLRAAFPDRSWYAMRDQDGVLTLAPLGQFGAPPAR